MIAYRVLCCTPSHLLDSLTQVIKDGGEGVVVRLPASYYEHGRSESLFKLKVSFSLFLFFFFFFLFVFFANLLCLKAARGDQEALVVTVLEDEGDETTLLLRLYVPHLFIRSLLFLFLCLLNFLSSFIIH